MHFDLSLLNGCLLNVDYSHFSSQDSDSMEQHVTITQVERMTRCSTAVKSEFY
jgi:hypothetical protein